MVDLNMEILQTYSEELAKLCTLNVKKCEMKIDGCTDTANFRLVGQNLAKSYSLVFESVESIITNVIQNQWYATKQYARQSDIDKFPMKMSNSFGTFTQMITEASIQVGCSIGYFADNSVWKQVVMCCNYARSNVIGTPVYVGGLKGSKCKSGVNPTFPGLCNITEVYNPNI